MTRKAKAERRASAERVGLQNVAVEAVRLHKLVWRARGHLDPCPLPTRHSPGLLGRELRDGLPMVIGR